MEPASDERREEAGPPVAIGSRGTQQDFVSHLGIDPDEANGLVMVAAQAMFRAPLPPNWSDQTDDGSTHVYFYNSISGEALWVHPQETLFKEVIEEVRGWLPDEPADKLYGRSDTHLRQGGPEEAPEDGEASAQFFYNATTGESMWADPRLAAEHDLRLRHAILTDCLAAHSQNLARLGVADSSDDEDGGRSDNVQAFVQGIWESFGSLSQPARGMEGLPLDATAPAGPGAGASPAPSARRPHHLLPEGSDTVRSSISYLTARSSFSETPREATSSRNVSRKGCCDGCDLLTSNALVTCTVA